MGFRGEFSLEKSLYSALSDAIPQEKRRLDRESTVFGEVQEVDGRKGQEERRMS